MLVPVGNCVVAHYHKHENKFSVCFLEVEEVDLDDGEFDVNDFVLAAAESDSHHGEESFKYFNNTL